MSEEPWVLPAFPRSVSADALSVAAALPPASVKPAGLFSVMVEGERLTIPYRIYQDDLADQYESWPATQRLVADCLYSRHHSGWVRERHARLIVENESPWVVPFVVHLVGEYVLDIVLAINERLSQLDTAGSAQQLAYGTFALVNPSFLRLTKARAVSYWDCYYRRQFPSLADYPGHRLLTAIEKAGEATVAPSLGRPGRDLPTGPEG